MRLEAAEKSRKRKKLFLAAVAVHARCSRCCCLSQFKPLSSDTFLFQTDSNSPVSLSSHRSPNNTTGHPRPRLGRRRPARRARRSQVRVCHRRRVAPQVGRCLVFPQVVARLGRRRRPRQGERWRSSGRDPSEIVELGGIEGARAREKLELLFSSLEPSPPDSSWKFSRPILSPPLIFLPLPPKQNPPPTQPPNPK